MQLITLTDNAMSLPWMTKEKEEDNRSAKRLMCFFLDYVRFYQCIV